jgi:hypothetical protein
MLVLLRLVNEHYLGQQQWYQEVSKTPCIRYSSKHAACQIYFAESSIEQKRNEMWRFQELNYSQQQLKRDCTILLITTLGVVAQDTDI